jgi:hypothetical protein
MATAMDPAAAMKQSRTAIMSITSPAAAFTTPMTAIATIMGRCALPKLDSPRAPRRRS